jgi:multiple sugar transport system substrate-binding protein
MDTLNVQISEAVENAKNGGQAYSADCGEMLLQLIKNASQKRIWDSQIESIVQEEVTAFFTGDKSAEETAKIIQNRVSIYLSEQS